MNELKIKILFQMNKTPAGCSRTFDTVHICNQDYSEKSWQKSLFLQRAPSDLVTSVGNNTFQVEKFSARYKLRRLNVVCAF